MMGRPSAGGPGLGVPSTAERGVQDGGPPRHPELSGRASVKVT